MNQHMKKLADQARFTNQVPYPSEDEVFQKFAELLISECINIAYEYDKPKLSGPGLAIASEIESHFDIYIEEDGRFVK